MLMASPAHVLAPAQTVCVHAFSVISDSFLTPWTIVCQAPVSMGFPRKEYWSGSPFPPPGCLPNSGTEPTSLVSSAVAGRFLPLSHLYRWCEVCRGWHSAEDSFKYRQSLGSFQWSMAPALSLGRESPLHLWAPSMEPCPFFLPLGARELGKYLCQVSPAATGSNSLLPSPPTAKLPD